MLLLILLIRLKPTKIKIDENSIYVETKYDKTACSLSKVKKVIDWGDVYEIVFHLPRVYPFCVCQKDLLCQGTLEEFQTIFKEKIIFEK